MKLSTKLAGGFTSVTAVAVVIAVVGYYGLSKIDHISDDIAKNNFPGCVGLLELKEAESAMQRTERTWILSGFANPEDKTQAEYNLKRMELQQSNYNKGLKQYEAAEMEKGEKELWEKYKQLHKEKAAVLDKIVVLCKAENYKDAYSLSVGAGRTAYVQLEKVLDELVVLKEKSTADDIVAQDATTTRCKMLLALGTLLGIGLSAALSLTITKGTLKQLGADPAEVTKILSVIAQGDFTQDIKQPIPGSVLASLREMMASLRELITQANLIAETISSASTELQATSEQIATGAEEAASQAGTVATSSEEMSHTARDIAQNCQQAASSSDQAVNLTQSGMAIVNETVNGIKYRGRQTEENATLVSSLGKRSEQIGEIVSTIEDIADQTNLLALNAAIEAARAGEQGRGFAVVADEVRALAERTTRATKEISTMIKSIQSETKQVIAGMEAGVVSTAEGVQQASTLEDSLNTIIAQISDVMAQVGQIATAAEEQTAVTHEVSSNILQISDVVQLTASGAEETAKASANLAEQAQQLQTALKRFKV